MFSDTTTSPCCISGVMKATFLPPTKLLHPVLPMKCNNKLKFPLCYTCAEKDNKNQCTCTEKERSFTHTYCTPEIETAINMGYQIVEIHEVLHWEETEMFDVKNKKVDYSPTTSIHFSN